MALFSEWPGAAARCAAPPSVGTPRLGRPRFSLDSTWLHGSFVRAEQKRPMTERCSSCCSTLRVNPFRAAASRSVLAESPAFVHIHLQLLGKPYAPDPLYNDLVCKIKSEDSGKGSACFAASATCGVSMCQRQKQHAKSICRCPGIWRHSLSAHPKPRHTPENRCHLRAGQ